MKWFDALPGRLAEPRASRFGGTEFAAAATAHSHHCENSL
jgi:hypothetical protein